jgi:nicotinate-nucleotide adenylyltransferase
VAKIIPISQGQKIGLLGGSFNPAHFGHMHATKQVFNRTSINTIFWLVTPQNPLKNINQLRNFEFRYNSAKAIAKYHKIKVTDFEKLNNLYYTYETIKVLKKLYKRSQLFWIMGSDTIFNFAKWYKWQEILKSIPIIIVHRGHVLTQLRKQKFAKISKFVKLTKNLANLKDGCWTYLNCEFVDCSSTEIRRLSDTGIKRAKKAKQQRVCAKD